MRLVLTPLFFLVIAAAAGIYAGPAAGIDELHQAPPTHGAHAIAIAQR